MFPPGNCLLSILAEQFIGTILGDQLIATTVQNAFLTIKPDKGSEMHSLALLQNLHHHFQRQPLFAIRRIGELLLAGVG